MRPTRNSRTSIIHFTVTIPDNGALNAWFIDEELSTPSDHDVVVCDLANMDKTMGGMRTSWEVTDWNIRTLSEDDRKKAACNGRVFD